MAELCLPALNAKVVRDSPVVPMFLRDLVEYVDPACNPNAEAVETPLGIVVLACADGTRSEYLSLGQRQGQIKYFPSSSVAKQLDYTEHDRAHVWVSTAALVAFLRERLRAGDARVDIAILPTPPELVVRTHVDARYA
jgi:hypothetical protein